MKSSNKKILKSKTKIKEILDDPMINRNNRDENMKQIKKFFVILEIIFSNQKKDHYKPTRNGNAFSSNYIEYESNGDKGVI